jgi:tetratricopeptide (TPR) repeat protein
MLDGGIGNRAARPRLAPPLSIAQSIEGGADTPELKLGEYDGAISDFNEALRLKSKLASSLFGRGKARLQKGNTSAGNADLKAARGLDPTSIGCSRVTASTECLSDCVI